MSIHQGDQRQPHTGDKLLLWSDFWAFAESHTFDEVVKLPAPNWWKWCWLERRLNNGSPSGFHSTVSYRHAAAAPDADFALPLIAVRREICTVLGVLPPYFAQSREPVDESSVILVPVHPDVLPDISKESYTIVDRISVSPTASGRTLAIVDPSYDPHFLKLHYPRTLGRYTRDLSLHKWAQSALIQAHLVNERELLATKPEILEENAGVFIEAASTERGWGVIARNARTKGDYEFIVPAFSLFYSSEHGTYPLLNYLKNKYGISPSLLAVALVEAYFDFALNIGYLPECNAQNVAFGVSRAGRCRPIFRDLGDFYVDYDIRVKRGLDTGFVDYKTIDEGKSDLVPRRSVSYDFKLGEYVLRPLAIASEAIGLEPAAAVCGSVREAATRALAESPAYFGENNVRYSLPKRVGISRYGFEAVDSASEFR
jgi:hypothetical protein